MIAKNIPRHLGAGMQCCMGIEKWLLSVISDGTVAPFNEGETHGHLAASR
jgi:hypothetical protein